VRALGLLAAEAACGAHASLLLLDGPTSVRRPLMRETL
jgi:hypothetical protein